MRRYTYYLSLGSNIHPAQHLSTALHQLQAKFGHIMVWPVVCTAPVDILTQHEFYNTLVVIHSEWPPEQLKAWTNELEITCGRDRSDPMSSKKDRPLDVDVLAQQGQFDLAILAQFKEPYIQAVIRAGNQPNNIAGCQQIEFHGRQLGHCTAAINTHHTSGHIMVIEDSIDSLFQRFKAPFHRQQGLSEHL